MNEKEKRLRKTQDAVYAFLFLGVVLALVCLGAVGVWSIIIAARTASSTLLTVGIVCLCFYGIVVVTLAVWTAIEVKLCKEVERRETEENKEELNALVQLDDNIEQKEQAKGFKSESENREV